MSIKLQGKKREIDYAYFLYSIRKADPMWIVIYILSIDVITSTLIAAPISRPMDCATSDVSMHIFKYIRNRSVSNGCDVMKYTIIT